MAENGRSGRGSGPEQDSTQIQRHQNIQDEEDRLKELWQELEDSEDGEDIDPEKFLRDMAILDEINPLPDFDLSASWEDLQEKYALYHASSISADQQSSAFDSVERPKRRRTLRSVRAVIALVLVAAMLILASCGIIDRIIQAIADWSEDIFNFQVTQELRVEEPAPELPDTQYFDSLEEALDTYGVTTAYTGIKFPEGYVFHDVRVADLSDSIKILAEYAYGKDEIVFTIWHYYDSTSLELNAAEKLPTDAELYICKGIKHYILENSETTTLTWVTGSELYRIAGSFSKSQAEQMINSIYKGTIS